MNALELERRARVWDPPAVPTLVVAPHPDDESLATGGLIARQAGRASVHVVAVTDGEASRLASTRPGWSPERLARIRSGEQERALRRLAVGEGPAPTLERVGIPDGRVADHVDELAGRLRELLPRFGIVVAPWIGDHHGDHVAVAEAVHRALGDHRGERPPGPHLHPPVIRWSMFWAWHHPPPDFDRAPLTGLALTPEEQNRKSAAIACHTSQISDELGDPVMPGGLLLPVLGIREYYVEPSPRWTPDRPVGRSWPSPGDGPLR